MSDEMLKAALRDAQECLLMCFGATQKATNGDMPQLLRSTPEEACGVVGRICSDYFKANPRMELLFPG